MAERLYLYPLWIRIWHWVNAFMFLVLVVTGLSMQYSSPDYPMIRFDIAVSLHNIAGIVVTLGYLYFIIINRFSSNRKYYRFKRKGFIKRLLKQFNYYTVGVYKHADKPYPVSMKRKFNPLQKFTYLVVLYILMPIVIITGFALLYPEINLREFAGFSGIHLTDLLHIIVGFFLSVFMVVHIYFCTLGTTPTSDFKSMINGWHE
ncbi:MAG: cytochrome b/b6 domain-containing protein [Bacteroidales bacterium]